MSICMLQMSLDSISEPLSIIFRNCLKTGCYLFVWKKGNVVVIHKKGDKQILKNNWCVSCLLICSKRFEKVIFSTIFRYLTKSNLLNLNQSGFMSCDSYAHQLMSIVHEIYASFDAKISLEVSVVFLEIYLKYLIT